ncbi:aminotransferase class V-fold PLP-dependent enzyme [Alteromonas sp. a30]|uniref:aminotransferase class V-fold PLP-dependent enzyme n=1 Tax=Alteromonas sp. a30 TaxID=2730917 RepID=UPI0022806DD3|nr:SufS family cysteine desulfurase [Alteromonas sp. a30]MCY7296404.1 SufS family cysteine desulfurase [Alteromonas sp. a30]
MSFDVLALRESFPILKRTIEGKPLIYLDNAATTQKPQAVIEAITSYYVNHNSNVHRGVHTLADESTRLYEASRDSVAQFIHANDRKEVIWTSGTTEAINIVAHGLQQLLSSQDEIVVTEMEHHANLVTWQQVSKGAGAKLNVARITDDTELDIAHFESLLSTSTKMVAMPHVSNALGTVNPIETLIPMIRQKAPNARILIDGAQGVAHGGVDVQALDCDFYAFSGHKLFAPTGVGVLWGKAEILADWPVWQTGGEMIATVTYQDATWGELPNRLEAGTPHIAGVVGFGAAVDWFTQLDISALQAHEKQLMSVATEQALAFEGLELVSRAKNKIGVLSFNLTGSHPSDVGFLLDKQGIAVRTGDHCAQPLMQRLNVPGTVRASFSIYNTLEEIDALFSGLKKVQMMLM